VSAPLVVNTSDGTVWTRRAVMRDGEALYALADVDNCPETVMATLAELAEHGIAGSADVLPMPVGPAPRTLDVVEEELTGANLCLWEEEQVTARLRLALASAQRGRRGLRSWVAELEAERAKYVGVEPTIAEEMAHLNRCIDAVDALRLPEKLKADTTIAPEYRSGYVHALADMRTALESAERSSYPPAFPWAALMDDEDLAEFLGDLIDALNSNPPRTRDVLTEVEKSCATWRLIAEAQHGHNTAPGPDAEASADGITRRIAPTQALAPEGEHYAAVHHAYRVSHDLPESGGAL
jgi:hypothetical protein